MPGTALQSAFSPVDPLKLPSPLLLAGAPSPSPPITPPGATGPWPGSATSITSPSSSDSSSLSATVLFSPTLPDSAVQGKSALRKITRRLVLDFATCGWTGHRDSLPAVTQVCPLMILHSARFRRFCHPLLLLQLRLHTSAPSDDHGQLRGSSQVLGSSGRTLSTVAASSAATRRSRDQDSQEPCTTTSAGP